ncbi:signal peptidase I [uncultured Flavobacterium sp.]|uniref:signal peptidase I n=1 Tax=uncultured Flavobacterium sp. TaxID=165435 RepID=UPI0030CA153F
MTALQWLLFIAIVQIIHGFGTWKLYEKADRKSWEAFIPVYNAIVLMQIINRPKWYTFLLFIPVINLIMFPVLWVETIRSFGYNSSKDTLYVILTFGLYIYYINYTQKPSYIVDRSLVPSNKTADIVSSLLFAIVVATFVHTYFIQPFTIPTSSLEKSLLVGDFLFVSKFNYGARVPMTTVAAPMVHDSLPFVKIKSYTTFPQLPYFRFPGFEKIKNNDIVVFNWPTDTLYNMYKVADKRYDKPIDKKTNYVKRCVGIAGDSLQIIDGIVFINGEKLILPERAKPQYYFKIILKESTADVIKKEYAITESYPIFEIKNEIWDKEALKTELIKNYAFNEVGRDSLTSVVQGDIDQNIYNKLGLEFSSSYFYGNLTDQKYEQIKTDSRIKSVERKIRKDTEDGIFPDMKDGIPSTTHQWNNDNFGPIYIPKKGATVAINKQTLPFYKKIINEYEENDLQVNGNEIRINGQVSTTYTFKQNYYWMMGDNRHNSLDARYFGYTPENHIVGKPIFIWMSIDGINDGIKNWSIRWDRLFTTVSGEGQPQSYFKFFLIFLAGYFAFDYFKNKKKKKKDSL